ncbi:hypothetical protein H7F15_07855 [Pontibacter sp. Tf4]|uniref:hypothetical protein n=1 Tax=Pontibacter sp. Tf4 TaxID=2761620 RepID=UPI00162428F8|nr:hypothetical protein [Pontibacter sp. Tf4]MBB6610946.1 hypothetical protein [Pontibacter sp. Tf4]
MSYIWKLLLLTVALLLSIAAHACDCAPLDGENWKPITVQKHLGKADLIFIGEVISSEGDQFAMKALDIFKGEIKGDTVYGEMTNTCTYAPEDGLWIVYAAVGGNGKIELDMCSLTRSLTGLGANPPPPPPMPGENISEEEQEERAKAHYPKTLPLHLKNWINEYALLVGYRNSIAEPEPEVDQKNYINYAALLISLLALIITLLKKKHN